VTTILTSVTKLVATTDSTTTDTFFLFAASTLKVVTCVWAAELDLEVGGVGVEVWFDT